MADKRDYYETLGVSKSASETEIKSGNKEKIMYIDLINIGQFNNFGYIGSYTNYNLYFIKFIESLHNHFTDIFTRIKELQSNVSN